jgi:hypothetical protein
LENIADQVKEATYESFDHVKKQQEEMNSDMQALIFALQKFLETTKLVTIQTRK